MGGTVEKRAIKKERKRKEAFQRNSAYQLRKTKESISTIESELKQENLTKEDHHTLKTRLKALKEHLTAVIKDCEKYVYDKKLKHELGISN